MSFPNLTPERISAIQAGVAALFNPDNYERVEPAEVKVEESRHYHRGESHPAIKIEVGAMYERPQIRDDLSILAVFNRIAELTGCKEVDKDECGHGGCETCDYGSYYSYEFYAFDPIAE